MPWFCEKAQVSKNENNLENILKIRMTQITQPEDIDIIPLSCITLFFKTHIFDFKLLYICLLLDWTLQKKKKNPTYNEAIAVFTEIQTWFDTLK